MIIVTAFRQVLDGDVSMTPHPHSDSSASVGELRQCGVSCASVAQVERDTPRAENTAIKALIPSFIPCQHPPAPMDDTRMLVSVTAFPLVALITEIAVSSTKFQRQHGFAVGGCLKRRG
jgi:hypothetical protein